MSKKKHLVIYHEYIPKVGGIESAIFNLAKVLKDTYKITIVYIGAESTDTLFRYATVADVQQLDYEKIECDTLLLASNHFKPKNINAKKIGQWIHSDYEQYSLVLKNKDVDFYVSVSEHAGRIAKKLFKIDYVTIPNIIDPDFELPKPNEVLKLVTNSRISPEKGFGRMLVMAKQLREAKIAFNWQIYGDNSVDKSYENKVKSKFSEYPEVTFMGFKEDIRMGLMFTDYLVQLSDFEGCPYAVLEALKVGVPCILSSFPAAKELIKNGVNGYIVPLEMKRINYKQIVEKIPKDFKFNQDGLIKKWKTLI